MITIIGAGNAGKALGKAFLQLGKEVYFGVSSVSKYQDIITSMSPHAHIGTVQQAISLESECLILAVPYQAALEIASSMPDWNRKILVDISTPWLPDLSGLAIGLTSSAAETISKAAHNARVVKAFNTMGAECFDKRSSVNGRVFMPVCSDDEEAKKIILQLGEAIGLDAIDAGNLKNARATEPMVLLWLQLTFNLPKGRTFEFGLLNKT